MMWIFLISGVFHFFLPITGPESRGGPPPSAHPPRGIGGALDGAPPSSGSPCFLKSGKNHRTETWNSGDQTGAPVLKPPSIPTLVHVFNLKKKKSQLDFESPDSCGDLRPLSPPQHRG